MTLPKADALALLLIAIAACTGLLLSLTRPFLAPDAEPVFTFGSPQQKQLFSLVEAEFGLFTAPKLSADWLPQEVGDLQTGRSIYQVQCLHCHGSDGGADTPTARLLNPPPRNFSLGVVTHSSTVYGTPPLRDDLRRTVHDGIDKTSMSSFAGLPEVERHAAVDYAMYLLVRGAVWNQALNLLESSSPADAINTAIVAQKARWANPELRQ